MERVTSGDSEVDSAIVEGCSTATLVLVTGAPAVLMDEVRSVLTIASVASSAVFVVMTAMVDFNVLVIPPARAAVVPSTKPAVVVLVLMMPMVVMASDVDAVGVGVAVMVELIQLSVLLINSVIADVVVIDGVDSLAITDVGVKRIVVDSFPNMAVVDSTPHMVDDSSPIVVVVSLAINSDVVGCRVLVELVPVLDDDEDVEIDEDDKVEVDSIKPPPGVVRPPLMPESLQAGTSVIPTHCSILLL